MTTPDHHFIGRIERLISVDALRGDWTNLEARAHPTFFTSWIWISAWLDSLPMKVRPRVLRVTAGGRTVGLATIGRRLIRRSGIIASRALFLNETGDPFYDELTVEYNGILAEEGLRSEVAKAAMQALGRLRGWDECFLRAVSDGSDFEDVVLRGARPVALARKKYYYVNLESLGGTLDAYLARLGPNTRHSIRRSLREYESIGPVRLIEAADADQAVSFLGALKILHQSHWVAQGLPGSFANPYFEHFHTALIRNHFTDGCVQLLEIRAGEAAIGYLYNLVHQGRVLNYSSGLNYSLGGAHGRPGLVAHALAIDHNRRAGHSVYDLMAGEGRHKSALGNESGEMTWAVVQRRRARFAFERALRRIWRRVAPFVRAGSSEGADKASASGGSGQE